MHELTVAASILKTALGVAEDNDAATVVEVRLRVGVLSCLNPETLRFGFDALAKGTVAEGCVLDVASVAADGVCRSCGWEGAVTDPFAPACPECEELALSLSGGQDLCLETVTVE